jgi:hypothetical protein
LARVNEYRAQAELPMLTDDPDWSQGGALHARYMVKTDLVVASEDPVSFPDWFTTEGNQAAANSLLVGLADAAAGDASAIDLWMRSPFQALSILDPELRASGFGSYREADGGVQMAAALDVRRGWQASAPAGITFPIRWPGPGRTVNLRTYGGYDAPDPTRHPGCAGHTGLPILLQVGDGTKEVSLTAPDPTVLSSGGSPLFHCVFSEADFSVPGNPGDTDYGRLLLGTRDAIVLLPKDPLAQGAAYTVAITATVDGVITPYTWSFTVAPDANP